MWFPMFNIIISIIVIKKLEHNLMILFAVYFDTWNEIEENFLKTGN